jgi:hypothetical protein
MRTRDEDSRRGLVVRTREPLAPFSCFIVIGFVSPSGPMENVLRFLEGKTLLAAGPCTPESHTSGCIGATQSDYHQDLGVSSASIVAWTASQHTIGRPSPGGGRVCRNHSHPLLVVPRSAGRRCPCSPASSSLLSHLRREDAAAMMAAAMAEIDDEEEEEDEVAEQPQSQTDSGSVAVTFTEEHPDVSSVLRMENAIRR